MVPQSRTEEAAQALDSVGTYVRDVISCPCLRRNIGSFSKLLILHVSIVFFQSPKCNDLPNKTVVMSCSDNSIIEPKMSASFVPDHKAPMVLFLDRVYGIDNQDFLLHVLEVGFLPDMRAAASLDTVRVTHPPPASGSG